MNTGQDQPINEQERKMLRNLYARMHGPLWWADRGDDGTFRLFNAGSPEEHGYQILKAPSQELAGNTFAAYTPNTHQEYYIVAALNAVPKYEAKIQDLEKKVDALYEMLQLASSLADQAANTTIQVMNIIEGAGAGGEEDTDAT